ncbi:UvrD-helicase domain-containing protein [Flavobacterium tructae]|uniref:DNA 3'-5' helicase n=1 Tax=Flavobacterium tructae TaxID=1114873 RepID=A0A1S1J2W7_9FLAO|nr:ATP-dependent helicase [Flavobacterium tructae]OHT43809.1 ATP-dependent DNA helicase [Flavobacterium tructae]OXB20576.1 ATP-dependent DNA helicase [Flavobacterium tructae]
MFTWNEGDLNKEQEDAIYEKNSIILIACPGSGKTRTLTYKIAYELSRLESEKQYIIAITYTNAAADEIKERVELLGVNINQLWIGTIHSFCLEWILRPYSLYINELKEGFRILNSHESEEIISTLCVPYKKQKITHYQCNYIAKKGQFIPTSCTQAQKTIVNSILNDYFKILRKNKQIDFEQILFYSDRLLKEKKIISSILSKIFPFILIDEYQDTKEIQYDIVSSILSANKGNSKVLIVGDPNQSIYESLGGFAMSKNDLEDLLNFPLVKYSLSQNYRSSTRIINYFDYYKTFDNQIIPSGEDKEYKSVITFNPTIGKENIVNEIVRLILFNINEKGVSPNEICIVAPQWIHLASLSRNLMIKLPDYSFDGPGLAPFSRDIDNFWYKLSKIVLTEPSPNLYVRRLRWSKEILENFYNAGADISISNKNFLKLCNSISFDEENGLEYLKLAFAEICSVLKVEIKLFLTLQEHYDSFFNSSAKRIERLINDGNEFIGSIENFRKVFKQREGITVSTIHGVKGEEYDTMIGFALLNDYVPHFTDENGLINSKKMLYVLASRARKNLHLISERGRDVHDYYSPTGKLPTSHLTEYGFNYD